MAVKTYTFAAPPSKEKPKSSAAPIPIKKAVPKRPSSASIPKEKKPLSESPPIKKRPALTIPSRVEPKTQTIEPEPISSVRYEEFLIPYLQSSLDLPEYGEVRAEITVNQFGKVIAFSVLNAKNTKNAEFLKREIPELSFPHLSDFGILESSRKFTITFRNR